MKLLIAFSPALPGLFLVLACLGVRALAAEPPPDLAAERRDLLARFPEAFAEVADDPVLPRVLLIGDSISIGYTVPVRELLKGVANVHRITDNGGPTTRGLQQLDAWLGGGKWDVIHFNFGLHDVVLVTEGQPRTTLADYEKNLRTLVTRLRATHARLIFALTTPVPGTTPHPPRRDTDVVACNEVARRVMTELGVPLNDLYGFAQPQLAAIQQPANVHYTPEGYRILAGPVAAAIRQALKP